jgi:hypothetical protein
MESHIADGYAVRTMVDQPLAEPGARGHDRGRRWALPLVLLVLLPTFALAAFLLGSARRRAEREKGGGDGAGNEA